MAQVDEVERRPLLGDRRDSIEGVAEDTTPAEDEHIPPSRLFYIVIVGLLINTSVYINAEFMGVSLNQLIEGAVCKMLYPDVSNPYFDKQCKSQDVQAQLSLVHGWDGTFAMMPGLLMAIPYGVFADSYGPRGLLLLVFAGSVLMQLWQLAVCLHTTAFDARWYWFGNMFSLIGGGNVGWEAMRYTVANSIASQSNRATVFFYLSVFTTLTPLVIGVPLYAAMERGPIFTNCIGTATLTFGGLLCLALPKSVGKMPVKPDSQDEEQLSAIAKSITAVKQVAGAVKTLFRDNIYLGMLLISLIFTTIGHLESIVRLQYATKRYDWSWSKAGLVTSMTSSISLFVLVVVIPIASRLLLKKLTPIGKDIWISRFGVICLALGSFGTGLAPTSSLFIASFAIYRVEICYTPAVISVIAGIAGVDDVHKNQTSLLYLCTSVMRSTGAIVAGPLLAEALRVGLRLGGNWLGLPFFVAGCLQVIAAVIVCSVRDKSKQPVHRHTG